MAPSAQAHKRSHSLLLFQKLLNLRDSASPLTLVLDTLEQSATPVVQEFVTRAKISHTKIIFISFVTIKKPSQADVFIKARGKPLQNLCSEIISHYPAKDAPPASQKTLLLMDTLNPLASSNPHHLPAFLSTLLTQPSLSLLATYHTDIPLFASPDSGHDGDGDEYTPHPLTTLHHLATAILRVSNLSHAIAVRRAQNRSLPEPVFGLEEGREGVLIGSNSNSSNGGQQKERDSVVVEMELRRRSGRAVVERFVLSPGSGVGLLADYGVFAAAAASDEEEENEMVEATFSLGLTEKQRRDREGIVLPYFDAQEDVGGGEGGRILYEMGREDDFDDEEDEI